MKFDKSEVTNTLKNNVAVVTFVKADGSTRVLKGTTNLAKIPVDMHPKGTGRKLAESSPVIPVFDIEANGWRSVNTSSLNSIEVVEKLV